MTKNRRKPMPPRTEKTQNWFSRMWSKFTTWIKNLASKFANAFRVKERDAEGRIVNQSWFGKYIASPIMRVMGWIGKALLWVAQFILTLIVMVALIAAILITALVFAVLALIAVVGLVLYRVILGICLALITPYRAYQDRAASDEAWEAYWTSWNPKYWVVGDLDRVNDVKAFYQKAKETYFTGDNFDWSVFQDAGPQPDFSGAAA